MIRIAWTERRWILGCGAVLLAQFANADQGLFDDHEIAIKNALAKVSEQCPRDVPARLVPLPEPGELAAKTDAQLVALLNSWNPAFRARVAGELALRGKETVTPLLEALAATGPELRTGALDALNRMVRNQLANWQQFRSEVSDAKVAQASIRQEFADLLTEPVLALAGDPQVTVRSGVLALLQTLDFQPRPVLEAVLVLCGDEDAYVADLAANTLGRGTGVPDIRPESDLPLIRKAIQNPLPGGRGAMISLIARADESVQRQMIPDLFAHLESKAARDTMAAASGHAQAIALLTKLKVKELIPRLPDLMEKRFHGSNLYDASVASIQAFGTDARPILPVLNEKLAAMETELQGLAGRSDRLSLERATLLQGRLESLRKAVVSVEQ